MSLGTGTLFYFQHAVFVVVDIFHHLTALKSMEICLNDEQLCEKTVSGLSIVCVCVSPAGKQ